MPEARSSHLNLFISSASSKDWILGPKPLVLNNITSDLFALLDKAKMCCYKEPISFPPSEMNKVDIAWKWSINSLGIQWRYTGDHLIQSGFGFGFTMRQKSNVAVSACRQTQSSQPFQILIWANNTTHQLLLAWTHLHLGVTANCTERPKHSDGLISGWVTQTFRLKHLISVPCHVGSRRLLPNLK